LPVSTSGAARGRLSDFYRHHGVWAPGVRLSRAVGFRAKAMLISAAFMVPIALLAFNCCSVITGQIEFTQKERVGTALLTQFVPVFQGVIETRNAARAMFGGFDAKKQCAQARLRTDAALAQLQSHLVTTQDPLGLTEASKKLKSAWDRTASSKDGVDDKGLTVFVPVTAAQRWWRCSA
jgi:hypothetical protein